MDDKHYWLGFNLVQTIGVARLNHLLAFFDADIQRAWHADARLLRQEKLLPEVSIQKLIERRAELDLEKEMATVRACGAHLVTAMDDAYPAPLHQIDDAPPVLYVRGTLSSQDHPALAVVGTRRATRYGRDATYHLAQTCASQGITIVSGLAQGIDTAAHRGALAGGGRTLAVLGSGIDILYPRENADLAHAIMEQGAVLSEFPAGTPPVGANFPRRNRIISGLCSGVLVGEAPEQSGALITAHTALEQGRDVFAIPANIFNVMGAGSNRLIQDGARLVMDVADILEELNMAYVEAETQRQTQIIAPADEREQTVLDVLENEPIHIDEIIRITGLAADEVLATLTVLELKGLAQTDTPMQYCRTHI